MTRACDVTPEQVDFIWPPYLAIGKFTLLQGDPGLGKTWAACKIAAAVTLGEALPAFGGEAPARPPGTVLYLSAEDGLADTLRPRLEAVGADLTKVVFLEGIWRPGTRGRRVRSAVTLRDAETLRRAIEDVRPSLLVIDPLLAYLGGADSNKAHEVREVLTPIVDLAQEYRFAALGLRHLNKGTTARAHQRGQGSGDFTAAARSVLLLGESPDGDRAIVHIKNNVGPVRLAIGFEVPAGGGFYWRGRSPLTGDDLLAPAGKPTAKTTARREDARGFLLEFLAQGPRGAIEAMNEAENRRINKFTLKRAKDELRAEGRLRSQKIHDDGSGRVDQWEWVLVPGEQPGEQPGTSPIAPLDSHGAENGSATESHPEALQGQLLSWQEGATQESNPPTAPLVTIQSTSRSYPEEQLVNLPACAREGYLTDPDEETGYGFD